MPLCPQYLRLSAFNCPIQILVYTTISSNQVFENTVSLPGPNLPFLHDINRNQAHVDIYYSATTRTDTEKQQHHQPGLDYTALRNI